jgi:2-keto-4-pentenoate hydratase/2-oxohepta-3-ene-1,7-dioic acid hydratase in catechol pathway
MAGGPPQAGVLVDGDRILSLQAAGQAAAIDLPVSLLELLDMGAAGLEQARDAVERARRSGLPAVPLDQARLLAPLPRPRHIYALAGNYVSHIEESGQIANEKAETTMRPFMKPSNSIIGPRDPIRLPTLSDAVDYEVELAVVVGRRASRISADQAPDCIAGYAVFNDVSGRSLTITEGRKPREGDWFFDWLLGKWFDSFAIFGPVITTADELPDPHGLAISLSVNGDIRQSSSTAQMIFNSYEILSFLSQIVPLEPGAIIATGTPSGVGAVQNRFLAPGDVLEASIAGLGTLRNVVHER